MWLVATPTAWKMRNKKFKDDLNTAVFCLRQIVFEGHPILIVSHDRDGDWQFLNPNIPTSEANGCLVGLDEIIDHDPTVVEVADLPVGKRATRRDSTSQWEVEI